MKLGYFRDYKENIIIIKIIIIVIIIIIIIIITALMNLDARIP